jgi:hypothetical protein
LLHHTSAGCLRNRARTFDRQLGGADLPGTRWWPSVACRWPIGRSSAPAIERRTSCAWTSIDSVRRRKAMMNQRTSAEIISAIPEYRHEPEYLRPASVDQPRRRPDPQHERYASTSQATKSDTMIPTRRRFLAIVGAGAASTVAPAAAAPQFSSTLPPAVTSPSQDAARRG